MDSNKYQVFISWSNADSAFLAVCPQLEGCIAHGESQNEALENLQYAVSDWLVSAKEFGWDVPAPFTTEDVAKTRQKRDAKAQKNFEEAVTKVVKEIVEKVILPQVASMMEQAQSESSLLPQLNEWENSTRGGFPAWQEGGMALR